MACCEGKGEEGGRAQREPMRSAQAAGAGTHEREVRRALSLGRLQRAGEVDAIQTLAAASVPATGDDTVELSVHGGALVPAMVMAAAIGAGAWMRV